MAFSTVHIQPKLPAHVWGANEMVVGDKLHMHHCPAKIRATQLAICLL